MQYGENLQALDVALNTVGVLTESGDIVMHDCGASYWNYTNIQNVVCCAHLLHELTGFIENRPEQT